MRFILYLKIFRNTGVCLILFGLLGIVIVICSFPFECEPGYRLLINTVSSFIYIFTFPSLCVTLGWIIFQLSKLFKKLMQPMQMEMEEKILHLSQNEMKALRNNKVYRFAGILAIVFGVLGIVTGIHSLLFECEHMRYVTFVQIGFSFGLIPSGWILFYLIKQMKLLYDTHLKEE